MPLTLGRHTYGKIEVMHDNPEVKVQVGNYCSIASCSVMGFSQHHYRRVSTYPFAELFGWGRPNAHTRGDTTIAHDVWIGADVLITGGITVHTGAVIAARAVVTKDVPPYAIVAGIPAKIVGYRYSEDIREKLLQSKWWERTPEELSKYAELITRDDDETAALEFCCALEDDASGRVY